MSQHLELEADAEPGEDEPQTAMALKLRSVWACDCARGLRGQEGRLARLIASLPVQIATDWGEEGQTMSSSEEGDTSF